MSDSGIDPQLFALLTEQHMTELIREVLLEEDPQSHVSRDAKLGEHARVDLLQTKEVDGTSLEPTTIFEVKRGRTAHASDVQQLAGYATIARNRLPEGTPIKAVLVVPGGVTASGREAAAWRNVEVWDAPMLARKTPSSILEKYLSRREPLPGAEAGGASSAGFKRRLAELPSGGTGLEYQALCREIFDHLFSPPLSNAHYEISDKAGRNRRDMIYENHADSGLWAQLRVTYQADYVVVDSKNHSTAIGKDEVIGIAHYLKPYGTGMFGIVVSRLGASEACEHAVREQWIGGRKLVVVLSDKDVMEMLDLDLQGGEPAEVIRSRISAFRLSL